jgi:hypothetical protein
VEEIDEKVDFSHVEWLVVTERSCEIWLERCFFI